jgi:hypothetical protein
MDIHGNPFKAGYRMGIALLVAGLLLEGYLTSALLASFGRSNAVAQPIWMTVVNQGLAYAFGILGLLFIGITFFHQMARAVARINP